MPLEDIFNVRIGSFIGCLKTFLYVELHSVLSVRLMSEFSGINVCVCVCVCVCVWRGWEGGSKIDKCITNLVNMYLSFTPVPSLLPNHLPAPLSESSGTLPCPQTYPLFPLCQSPLVSLPHPLPAPHTWLWSPPIPHINTDMPYSPLIAWAIINH